MAAKIEQRNNLLDKRSADIQKLLKTDGFSSVILKGQRLSMMYKDSPLRQGGDIDVWVKGRRKKIIEYARRKCDTNEVSAHHIDFPVYSDVSIELHFWPSVLWNFRTNRILQNWYNSHSNEQFNNTLYLNTDNNLLTVPTAAFNVVLLITHMYHHLYVGGINLKQLMDLYYVLNQDQHTNSFDIINKVGCGKFCGALMWILSSKMDLDESRLVCGPN